MRHASKIQRLVEHRQALRAVLNFDDPYVVEAAGFWLRHWRAPQLPEPENWKQYRERKAFMREAILCLSAAANSSCMTPTATR